MNFEALAKKARYFKQDEKGVAAMSKILEDMRNEAAQDKANKTAVRLIKLGKMTLEEIAEATELPLDIKFPLFCPYELKQGKVFTFCYNFFSVCAA